jgi:predicted metal-dependent peptidase
MTTDLEGRILKAKIEIMTKSVFISTICLSVKHTIRDDIPTAQTNGLSIEYGSEFINKLSAPELAGLMAHECWHIAYQHLPRRGTRDPYMWNVAGDYVINNMLLAANFSLPPKGLVDPKYGPEWSTDAIYEDLMKNDKEFDFGNVVLDIIGEPAGGSAGQTDKELADQHTQIVDILVKAHTQSKMAGKDAGEVPQEISRVIDKLINPKIPWPVILQRFLHARVKEEYSWNRKNRRYKTYMPSLHSYGLGHLIWAIDTSGSQDDDDLRGTLSEIKSVQDMLRPESLTILDCDSKIHNIYSVDHNVDILSLKFSGGGGTRFKPVFDYVAEHPADALVYFTDLYGESELPEVDFPVLWICNSTHAPSPIGETVYIDP